jgi:hypothetical protein
VKAGQDMPHLTLFRSPFSALLANGL